MPPPRGGNGNGHCNPQPTPVSDPSPLLTGTRRDLGPLTLHRVACPKDSRLWNELIARYHYLGYTPLPGAQIRYLIRNESHLLGAIGMGAAAWKVAPGICSSAGQLPSENSASTSSSTRPAS